MSAKVTIIDYNIGNIQSVAKAIEFLGAKISWAKTPEDVMAAEKIIMPGVSAFGAAVKNLKSANLDLAIKEKISKGTLFLGICVGYQILFERSEETPDISGLGILKGSCVKFKNPELIVPHMGWNNVKQLKKSRYFKNIDDNAFFYFVHSYFPEPSEKSIKLCLTDYEETFCSAVEFENITATQFHPEKSQKNGLKFLENFLKD